MALEVKTSRFNKIKCKLGKHKISDDIKKKLIEKEYPDEYITKCSSSICDTYIKLVKLSDDRYMIVDLGKKRI